MRALTVTAAVVLVLIASATVFARAPKGHLLTPAYSFEQYLADHGKTYACPHERAERKANFERNLASVLRHNANPSRTYTQGVNHLSDWSAKELKRLRGARHEPLYQAKPHMKLHVNSNNQPAASLDYRQAYPAVLTAVKDQGMCGDCWAHAVTESIESAHARATGDLFVLSQQQITACTPSESACYGCNGMYPRFAYDYAATQKQILEEWVYPFTAWNGTTGTCLNMQNPAYPLNNFVNVLGYTQIAPNRESDIVDALNTLGPLSILVDAAMWSPYESGIFNGCQFDDSFGLDHAVQLVGYGHDAEKDLDYWIVRNSWSAAWGEHGYIRLQKNATAACGLNNNGMSCFANGNNTQPVPSCGMCGVLTDAQFPTVTF